MFKEMKRKDRAMDLQEAKNILEGQEVGIFSTVDSDGQPYGVPVNYVYDHQTLYFHCALEGHKLENIKHNPKVCFTVYGESQVLPDQFTTNYESVVVFGDATIVSEAERDQALKMIIDKYSPGFREAGYKYIERAKESTAVVKININHMTGKARR